MLDDWITAQEAAELRGCTRNTIYRAVADGRLAAAPGRGRLRLRRGDVEALEIALTLEDRARLPRPKRRETMRNYAHTEESRAHMREAQRDRRARERGEVVTAPGFGE